MVNQLSTAAATTSTSGSSTTSAQAAAAILKYGGLSASVEKNKEKASEEPVTEDDLDYGSICKRVEVRIRGDYDHGCLAAVIAKLPKLRVFILRNEYDQFRPVLRRRPVAVVDALDATG